MLISAFWHGVYPGYFLSFLTIPLCTAAEDRLFNAFPIESRPRWMQYLFVNKYAVIKWLNELFRWSFIRMRGFELMASGFLLLDGTDTFRLWFKM